MQIQVGIITISDRASAGDYKDLGGPALKDEAHKAGWQLLAEAIVPDDLKRIQETIRSFAQQGCGLILMTGGTGIVGEGWEGAKVMAALLYELMAVEMKGRSPNSPLPFHPGVRTQ